MIENVISGVISAEKEACEIKAKAEVESANLITTAREKANLITENSIARAKEVRSEVLDSARTQADKVYLDEMKKAEEKAELIEKESEKLKTALADDLLGRLTSGNF